MSASLTREERRKWHWRVRLAAKDFIVHVGLGSRLVEYCETCGARVRLVWWSPNDVWLELTGHATPVGDNASGVLCERCFDGRAKQRGIILHWRPTIVHRRENGEWVSP